MPQVGEHIGLASVNTSVRLSEAPLISSAYSCLLLSSISCPPLARFLYLRRVLEQLVATCRLKLSFGDIVVEQQPHDGLMTVLGSKVQWPPAILVGDVYIDIMVEQQPRNRLMAVVGSKVQWRLAIAAGDVGISIAIKQELHDRLITVLGS
jgi:hypothetical protein